MAARPFAIDAVVREAVEGLGEQLAARVVTDGVQPLAVVAARDMGVMVVRILVEQAAECVAGEITVQARPVDGKVAVSIRGHEAPPGGGTAAEVGLSAYIARDLIESMGGRLDVDLGGGAPSFTAVLPAR